MADKIAYSDPSLQILNMFSQIGGTKQTTTGTSQGDPKAIAGLQQILDQQLSQITPEGAAALIQSVFQKGASQVPGLAMQFAQSAGARTSNNSPLNQANQQLQAKLAQAAMELLLQAQSNASNTAGKLADSNKTQTQSTTTKPRSSALALAPFVLGQAGNIKKLAGGVADLFGEGDTGFGSVAGGSGVSGFSGNNPSAYIAPDAGAAFDFGGSAGLDFGLDPMMAASDSLSALEGLGAGFDALSGIDSILGTAAESGLSAFDFLGFADGGLVRGREVMSGNATKKKMDAVDAQDAPVKKETSPAKGEDRSHMQQGNKSIGVKLFDYLRGYADGGMVKKTLTAKAPGYADGGSVRGVNAAPADAGYDLNMFSNEGGSTSTVAGGSATGADEPNTPTMESGLPDWTAETLGEDVISYFASLGDGGNSGWAQQSQFYESGGKTYMAHSKVADDRPQGEAGHGQAAPLITGIREFNMRKDQMSDWDAYQEKNIVDKVFNLDGTFNDIVVNQPEGNDGGMLASAVMSIIGMMSGNPALAFATGVGTRTGTEALKSSMNKDIAPHMFGGVDKSASVNPTRSNPQMNFANGGEIQGPTDGSGIDDRVPIMATAGEYIIPVDVVETFGEEFFDNLVAEFHTPASLQRFHGAGTPRSQQK